MNTPTDERNIDPIQEMTRLTRSLLNLDYWGFNESVVISPRIIYDSEWCRVKFLWEGWDYYVGNSIDIAYGRSYASNDGTKIIYNGQECHCWHRVNEALHFLDGLSPQGAVDQMRVHQRWPHVMEQFRQSELGQSLAKARHQPEWLVRMHAAIWEHYGQRLFELFDLRRPDLWEQY